MTKYDNNELKNVIGGFGEDINFKDNIETCYGYIKTADKLKCLKQLMKSMKQDQKNLKMQSVFWALPDKLEYMAWALAGFLTGRVGYLLKESFDYCSKK